MLSNLKEKFHNVQHELTNSLRSLKLDKYSLRLPTRVKSLTRPTVKTANDPHLEAGLKILDCYENKWRIIHSRTVNLARSAEEADVLITHILTDCEKRLSNIREISSTFAFIPKLVHGVQQISDQILNLQCSFDETEEQLLMLEDMIETQELREKQLEHRFQLALYQKKHAAELDDLKETLTHDHFIKVKEYEKRIASQVKERQAEFQEAFDQDLQQYKEGNFTPKRDEATSSVVSTPLEEIELEEDPYFLEEFLSGG